MPMFPQNLNEPPVLLARARNSLREPLEALGSASDLGPAPGVGPVTRGAWTSLEHLRTLKAQCALR